MQSSYPQKSLLSFDRTHVLVPCFKRRVSYYTWEKQVQSAFAMFNVILWINLIFIPLPPKKKIPSLAML